MTMWDSTELGKLILDYQTRLYKAEDRLVDKAGEIAKLRYMLGVALDYLNGEFGVSKKTLVWSIRKTLDEER
jgi:hypothetical protein